MARQFQKAFKLGLVVLAFTGLLAAAVPARAQAPALVSVSPEYQLAHMGDEFAVQVRIDDVQALYAFDVTLSFPPELLEALSATDADFVVFRADAEGANAALALAEVTLSDRDGYQIPCDTQDGHVRLGDFQLFLPIALK